MRCRGSLLPRERTEEPRRTTVDDFARLVLEDDFLAFVGGFFAVVFRIAVLVLVLPANSHSPRSQFVYKNEALGGSMSKLFAFYHRWEGQQTAGTGDLGPCAGADRAAKSEASRLDPLVSRASHTIAQNHGNLF